MDGRRQLGQTVAPKLYVALGISGAASIVGDERVVGIVAINKTPGADLKSPTTDRRRPV